MRSTSGVSTPEPPRAVQRPWCRRTKSSRSRSRWPALDQERGPRRIGWDALESHHAWPRTSRRERLREGSGDLLETAVRGERLSAWGGRRAEQAIAREAARLGFGEERSNADRR